MPSETWGHGESGAEFKQKWGDWGEKEDWASFKVPFSVRRRGDGAEESGPEEGGILAGGKVGIGKTSVNTSRRDRSSRDFQEVFVIPEVTKRKGC